MKRNARLLESNEVRMLPSAFAFRLRIPPSAFRMRGESINKKSGWQTLLLAGAFFLIASTTQSPYAYAQTKLTLWGEVKVKDSAADVKKPLSLTIVLYNLAGIVVGRKTVPSGGRYRFNHMRAGEYDLAIEVETNEIARVHVMLGGMPGSDFRQDLEFEWKAERTVKTKASTISAVVLYY